MTQTELLREELDRRGVKWVAYPYNPSMVTRVGLWAATEDFHGHMQIYINNLEPQEAAGIIADSGIHHLRGSGHFDKEG